MRLLALSAIHRIADDICHREADRPRQARMSVQDYMGWSTLCKLLVDYDKPLLFSRPLVMKERISLEDHLTWYPGRPYGEGAAPLAVIGASGVSGFVTKVVWLSRSGGYDLEGTWVTIKWNNGNETLNTIDYMKNVVVDE